MSDVESKLQPDITQPADADPLASQWMRYVASVAMTAIATVVAIGVDTHVSIPNLSLVFVIPVILAGLALGLGPALCAAILGALSFNFFLTEPRYSLAIDDVSNIWAMALLFVVGLIVSGVAFTSHRRAGEAARLRKQAILLRDYSLQIVVPRNADEIALITSQALAALFGVPAVVIRVTDGTSVSVKRTGGSEPDEGELEAARMSLTTGTVIRGGVYPHAASRFDFWPVQVIDGQGVVLGLAFDPDERPEDPDLHVRVIASILALVLGRQQSA